MSRYLHLPTNTIRFSAPMQGDLTMYSNKPSRFGEPLDKMVMALYFFKILSISECLHDDTRDEFVGTATMGNYCFR